MSIPTAAAKVLFGRLRVLFESSDLDPRLSFTPRRASGSDSAILVLLPNLLLVEKRFTQLKHAASMNVSTLYKQTTTPPPSQPNQTKDTSENQNEPSNQLTNQSTNQPANQPNKQTDNHHHQPIYQQ